MTNQKDTQHADHIRIPMTFTIRDVVFTIAAIISMVTAWGIFGTRLSVVEEKIIFVNNNVNELRSVFKELRREDMQHEAKMTREINQLEIRIRNLETHQAEIQTLIRKNGSK